MIELACHTWSFHDLTLPESLGTIARLGFRAVAIGSGSGWNAAQAARDPGGAAAEIARDLRLFHLRLSDLYLMFPRISVADDEARERDIAAFAALLPFAAALGTPGITVTTGVLHNAESGGASVGSVDAAAFERSADALRRMAAAAGTHGIALSFEPNPDSMTPTMEETRRMMDAVPDLRVTLDWANLVYRGAAHEAITTLLPQARHVHIRQAARGQLQLPHDKGRIDLKRAVGDMVAAHYDGALCVELLHLSGRHGVANLNAHREIAALRDTLRDARDGGQKSR
jgi:sugar phosphate isomerase/epimerase